MTGSEVPKPGPPKPGPPKKPKVKRFIINVDGLTHKPLKTNKELLALRHDLETPNKEA